MCVRAQGDRLACSLQRRVRAQRQQAHMAAAEWREHVASQAVAAAQHRAWAVEEGARVLRVRLDAGSAQGQILLRLGAEARVRASCVCFKCVDYC